MTGAWYMQWIYGGVTIASIYAVVIWIPLVAARWFAEDFRGPFRDGYLYLALGNLFGCLGTAGLSFVRSYRIITTGEMPVMTDPEIAMVFLSFLGLARACVIYASSLNGKPWRWRTFLGVMTLWTLAMAVRP